MRKSRSIAISAAVCSVAMITSQTRATDYSWKTATNGNWADPAPWAPGNAFPCRRGYGNV